MINLNLFLEFYSDLIKKEKTYILSIKFNPIAANQDDKYYPDECAYR